MDLFEEEIKAGKSPEIERFLPRWPEEERPRILLELISIEVFHQVKGRPVHNTDYSRFGEGPERHARSVRAQLNQRYGFRWPPWPHWLRFGRKRKNRSDRDRKSRI